jgi:hypothetical protein
MRRAESPLQSRIVSRKYSKTKFPVMVKMVTRRPPSTAPRR